MTHATESDHIKRNEIEIVTSVPEMDDGDAYGENGRNYKAGDGADDDNIDIDYEGSTSDSTNIEHSSPSSTTEFVHIDKCRGDESVSCPKNPHIRICEVQFCDGINDCPDNEDELNCPEHGRHFLFGFFRFLSLFIILFVCTQKKFQSNGHVTNVMFPISACESDEFVCDVSRCIPLSKRCDGEHNCHDLTDELNCPNLKPDPGKFRYIFLGTIFYEF